MEQKIRPCQNRDETAVRLDPAVPMDQTIPEGLNTMGAYWIHHFDKSAVPTGPTVPPFWWILYTEGAPFTICGFYLRTKRGHEKSATWKRAGFVQNANFMHETQRNAGNVHRNAVKTSLFLPPRNVWIYNRTMTILKYNIYSFRHYRGGGGFLPPIKLVAWRVLYMALHYL